VMAGKALERRKKEREQEDQKSLRSLMERTLQCCREDERVEKTLEATLRDIEFVSLRRVSNSAYA
jgi:hypothetical protein